MEAYRMPLVYWWSSSFNEKIDPKFQALCWICEYDCDYTTDQVLKGRFARVCVEIATNKPLVPLVRIGSIIQKVEGTNFATNAEANFLPWMMVDKKRNMFKGSGVDNDSDGQWQMVSRNKEKLSASELPIQIRNIKGPRNKSGGNDKHNTDGSPQFVSCSISKSFSGGMNGEGSNGAKSSREIVGYEEQRYGTDNGTSEKLGSNDTFNK
ncbi:hypothetical protein C5167_021889 [Papaver somniferum]|uniref:DUF4283 domain-containing protein n=1 Tax=Papaver somniferum TaxID=3469 RepID=A0A4Y7JH91_PAPSO|nr:hypothetical protein C5167_021889 [Papaver somniferum]